MGTFTILALGGGAWSASHPSSTEKEAGCVSELVWMLWRKKQNLASAGNQVTVSSHLTFSLILISAVLFQFMPSLGANMLMHHNNLPAVQFSVLTMVEVHCHY